MTTNLWTAVYIYTTISETFYKTCHFSNVHLRTYANDCSYDWLSSLQQHRSHCLSSGQAKLNMQHWKWLIRKVGGHMLMCLCLWCQDHEDFKMTQFSSLFFINVILHSTFISKKQKMWLVYTEKLSYFHECLWLNVTGVIAEILARQMNYS